MPLHVCQLCFSWFGYSCPFRCVSCVLVGLVTHAPSPVYQLCFGWVGYLCLFTCVSAVFQLGWLLVPLHLCISWVGYSCPFTCVSCVLVTRAPSVVCQLRSLALRYWSNLFLLCSACGRGTSDAEVKASAVEGLKQSSAPSFLCGRSDLVFCCCCLCASPFAGNSVFLTNHKTSQLVPLYFLFLQQFSLA